MEYKIADGVVAFSTEREEELPFYVVQPHQVHGCEIREVLDPMTTRQELEGVDALITNVPGVAISVRTADCIPVLLYDPVNRAVAAVHDGWRGTVQRLSQKVVSEMQRRYGTRPGDLKAVIGPGIGPESFQVGQEVVDAFADAGFPMAQWLLEELGVSSIQVSGICTYINNHRFFSARREGTKCGRIINCIKMM